MSFNSGKRKRLDNVSDEKEFRLSISDVLEFGDNFYRIGPLIPQSGDEIIILQVNGKCEILQEQKMGADTDLDLILTMSSPDLSVYTSSILTIEIAQINTDGTGKGYTLFKRHIDKQLNALDTWNETSISTLTIGNPISVSINSGITLQNLIINIIRGNLADNTSSLTYKITIEGNMYIESVSSSTK